MLNLPDDKRTNSITNVAVAALVGGLAGAFVGLMLAPKSGKELRQDIQQKADHAVEHIGNATAHHAGSLKQQGTDLVSQGKQLAEDLQNFIHESLKLKKSDYFKVNNTKETEAEVVDVTEDTPSEPFPQPVEDAVPENSL